MKLLWNLKWENRKLMKELEGVHYSTALLLRELFKGARYTRVSPYALEVLKKDVLGMVIEGAKREEKIDEILGGDRDTFMAGILKTCPKRSGLEGFFMYSTFFFMAPAIISFLNWQIFHRRTGLIPVTWGYGVQMVLMGVLFIVILLRNYNQKEWKEKVLGILLCTLQICLMMGINWYVHTTEWAWNLIADVPGCWITVLLGGLTIVMYFLYGVCSSVNVQKQNRKVR